MKLHRILALVIALAAFGVFLSAEPTFAQCSMCRGALGGNSALARNFNLGVLVLLAPPVSIFCAIFIIAIRNRKGPEPPA